MTDSVQQAKANLHQAKDVRDRRASEFWQRTIQAGRTKQIEAQTDEQKRECPIFCVSSSVATERIVRSAS